MPLRQRVVHEFRHSLDDISNNYYSSTRTTVTNEEGTSSKKWHLRFRLHCNRFINSDSQLLIFITIVSFFTRFYRLSWPANVVFDELHFGGFTEALLQRKFVFDIHPWLGKLTLAGFAKMFGYQVQGFEFEVTKPYLNSTYYYVRIPSALFGMFCPPLTYLIARELKFSTSTSFVTASLPLFDNLLLMESRLILLDAQLIFYLDLALLCALRLFNNMESDCRSSFRHFSYLIATALSCAAAMSVKWTAGATPFLIAITCFFGVWSLSRPLRTADCVLAAIVGLAMYTIPWYILLRVATHSTPSATRMSDRFRTTLHGNASMRFDPNHQMSFAQRVKELHIRQFVANKMVKTRHAYESKWYEWPLNIRGIFFFAVKANGYTEQSPFINGLYLIQNPAAALWVLFAVGCATIVIPVVYRYRHYLKTESDIHRYYSVGAFLLCGYVLNLVPYVFVERCYFIYHYLPALTYGQLLVGFTLHSLPTRIRSVVACFIVLTVVSCFAYFAPWIYGSTILMDDFKKRRWMPNWD